MFLQTILCLADQRPTINSCQDEAHSTVTLLSYPGNIFTPNFSAALYNSPYVSDMLHMYASRSCPRSKTWNDIKVEKESRCQDIQLHTLAFVLLFASWWLIIPETWKVDLRDRSASRILDVVTLILLPIITIALKGTIQIFCTISTLHRKLSPKRLLN